jgi:cytochrome c556
MLSCRRVTTRIWGWSSERVRRAGWWAVGGVLSLAAAGSLCGAWLTAADLATDQVAGFMRAKLVHSQNVLEGLTTEDFDLIERGAQELSLASLDSSWQVLQTEDYVRQSAEFRRSCDSLREAAQKRNLDGATVAWMDVTLKCVQCHKYVRDVD